MIIYVNNFVDILVRKNAFSTMEMRKITPEHKERVLQISKDIWEGDDYIPEIFDKWIADPYGEFVGLFDENTLVAFGKMTYLTPTDVWLEGLRKDQGVSVKGVCKIFTEYYLSLLSQKQYLTSVRFATYFKNHGSITPAERAGFQRVLTCSLKNLEIDSNEKTEVHPNITNDISYMEFKNYMLTSSYLKKCKNFLSKGWVLYNATELLLAEFYTKKRFGAWVEDGILKGLILFCNVYYSNSFWISFIEAENDIVRDSLLMSAKKAAQERQKNVLQLLVPEDNVLMDWVEKTGFASWDKNNDFFVFGMPLELLKIRCS